MKMETYLTRNGLLVVREDCAFFTDNRGWFRRLASTYEVEGLIGENRVKQVSILDTLFIEKLAEIDPPMWNYLWTVTERDYSQYREETSNNGGNYAFYKCEHFFARFNNKKWEIRAMETHYTSSEFEYDELTGHFTNDLNEVRIIGACNAPIEIQTALTQASSTEIVIDTLLTDTCYSIDEAICASDYTTGGDEEGFEILDYDEIIRRKNIAEGLGISDVW